MILPTKELSRKERKLQVSIQEELVNLYKRAGESKGLIEQYEPFLNSFFYLFEHGAFNLKNRSLRCFISKFTGAEDKEKNRYATSFKYANSNQKHTEYANSVFRKMNNIMVKGELRQNLILTLLILADRYEYRERNFTAYIMNSFPHELYRQLRDTHLQATLNSINYNDADNGDMGMPTTSMEKENTLVLNLDSDFELSHPEWVSGQTASKPFDTMTSREREILSIYYENKFFKKRISDRIIGQRLGRNVKSINRSRDRAVTRLKEIWESGDPKWLGIRKL